MLTQQTAPNSFQTEQIQPLHSPTVPKNKENPFDGQEAFVKWKHIKKLLAQVSQHRRSIYNWEQIDAITSS